MKKNQDDISSIFKTEKFPVDHCGLNYALDKTEPQDINEKYLTDKIGSSLTAPANLIDSFATSELVDDEITEAADYSEIEYYNRLVDLFEDYIQVYAGDINSTTEGLLRRSEVARRHFLLFSRPEDYCPRQNKDFAISLYRDSIMNGVDLDGFDKNFIKLGMLWQNNTLAKVEQRLAKLKFIDTIENTPPEEIEILVNMAGDKFLADYFEYVNKIESNNDGNLVLNGLNGQEFKRTLQKFGRFFQPDFNQAILFDIKTKIDQVNQKDQVARFINRAFLRAMAFLVSSDQAEYLSHRRHLGLGNTEEFEMELILPLVQDKMFVLMKYEEAANQSRTMTQSDRQSVIDLSMTGQQNVERKINQSEEKDNLSKVESAFRQKDPYFWSLLNRAFDHKK